MSRDWQPGDVALVEAGCWANRKVALRLSEGWSHVNGVNVDGDGVVSPVRRLVVIDPEDPAQVERLVAAFWANGADDFDDPAAMQSALRSLAAPPKPEEPTDPAARVKTSNGVEWAKVGPWWVCAWLSEVPRDWDYLVDLGVIL